MAAYLFEDDELPAGFRLPQDFVDLMAQNERPHFEWWFLGDYPEEATAWLKLLRESFPNRTLIPFAKYGIDPEVACFDGTDLSGDPAVLYVSADARPGHEHAGRAGNFAEWLKAEQESAR